LRNALRDEKNTKALHRAGWKVLIVRECEIAGADKLIQNLSKFLSEDI
jgi:G:T-mismatch repair DNA endonuclease (very short patch repair protein)